MTNATDEREVDEAGIEALLREVGARDEPSNAATEEVHAAVSAEWRAVVQERRRRRTIVWGAAAGFLFMMVAALFAVRFMSLEAVPVATIAHIDGHMLASTRSAWTEGSWAERAIGQTVNVGERIQTDDRSRAALELAGVSLRLDQSTMLRMASRDEVVLESGAIYVDSTPGTAARGLAVRTHAGVVRHVGTQYEVRTHADDIEVSVREGRVTITGAAFTSSGQAGETIRLTPQGQITRSSLSPRDARWEWAMAAAAPFDINDQPLSAFLTWVARETGRQVVYASAQARTTADAVKLKGSIAGLDPDTALNAVLATTQLRRFPTNEQSIGITLEPSD